MNNRDAELIKRLIDRLEHLSADSIYAHRASGLRGSLIRYAVRLEEDKQISHQEQAQLDELMLNGYKLLELAAKEVGAWR